MTVACPAAAPERADAGQGARNIAAPLAAVAQPDLLRDLHVLVVDDLADVVEVL